MTQPRRAPRRSVRGHHPDCPYGNDRPVQACGICRSMRIERTRHLAAVPDLPAEPPAREPELRSCLGCYAPTDNPDRTCPKCQPAQEGAS